MAELEDWAGDVGLVLEHLRVQGSAPPPEKRLTI
jgi:hypothetical protein